MPAGFLTALLRAHPLCPVTRKADPSGDASSTGSGGTCPMRGKAAPAASPQEAPVAINPANQMPAANQQMAPGQSAPLDTSRVESTIPQGDDKGNWVYPSQQMFYNALHRKGKAEGVAEEALESVVAIHNNMNEQTWKQVLAWEALHCAECKTPKLLRFMGRPDDLSPKAFLKYHLGMAPRPFDRHDWTVDRCGTEVRYIIDYYDVPELKGQDRVPGLHEEGAVPSIRVDARPALDSPTALFDRVRMAVGGGPAAEEAPAPSASAGAAEPAAEAAGAAAPPAGSGCPVQGSKAAAEANAVREACASRFEELQKCTDEKSGAMAQIALMMCIAQKVCPREADAFTSTPSTEYVLAQERFDAVEACVSRWGETTSQQVGSE